MKSNNSFTYGHFHYKGESPTTTTQCSDWNTYFKNSIRLPLETLYLSKMRVSFWTYNYDTNTSSSRVDIACHDESIIGKIQTAFQAKEPAGDFYCGGNKWSIYTCPSTGVTSFCANCTLNSTNCDSTRSCVGYEFRNILNPCKSCESHLSSFGAINFEYKEKILYPLITLPIENIVTEKYLITVPVNMSKSGTAYCAYFSSNTSKLLVSVYTIKSQKFSASTLASAGGIVKVLMNSGISPYTRYDVYCFTEDLKLNTMTNDIVLSTQQTVRTACCRSILSSIYYSNLVFPSTVKETVYSFKDNIFFFYLDSYPDDSISVNVDLKSYNCSFTQNSVSSDASAIPSKFDFKLSSKSLSGKFIIKGSPGCYNVTYSSESGTYDNFFDTLIIKGNEFSPQAPQLSTAIFSNDGRKLLITTDLPSDRGATSIVGYDSSFNCSHLLSFVGATTSNCLWFDDSSIIASFNLSSVLITSKLLGIGDKVTMLENKTKPICTNPKICDYSTKSSVTVLTPLKAIVPTVSMSSATVISSCDSITIDASLSTGNAGRSWSMLMWSVTLSDTINTTVTTYLNKNFNESIEDLITIPNNYLLQGFYTFTLSMKNFFGEYSSSSIAVEVSSSVGIPIVSIGGPSTISKLRNESIELFAIGSLPTCGDSSAKTLSYSWSVYSGANFMSKLTSLSLDQRFFKLNAYTLDLFTTYTILVKVSTSNGDYSTTSVNIQITSAGVKANIYGGSTITRSTSSAFSIDSSSSIDLNYITASTLSFTWTCMELTPSFGDPCLSYVNRERSVLEVNSTDLVSIIERTSYQLTVFVENSIQEISSASIIVTLIPDVIPVVSMGSIKSKYNQDDTVIISAFIEAYSIADANWTSTSIDSSTLQSYALTPISKVIKIFGSFTTYQLAIEPSTLTAGLEYTFQLSVLQRNSNITCVSSVTILINEAPSSGSLIISPTEGQAFSTAFFLVAKNWVDDPNDYPLTYIMSSYAYSISSQQILKQADQTSYIYSKIGAGSEINNYEVICLVNVTDIYGSSGSSSNTIIVTSIEISETLSSDVSAELENALSVSNPNLVIQISGSVVSSINSVSCTDTTECANLNRKNCYNTKNTCGECFEGYLGTYGDANDKCNLASEVFKIGEECADSSQCQSNKCIEQLLNQTTVFVCVEKSKDCPNLCSENGVCIYYDIDGNEVDDCTTNDFSCKASCTCSDGYFGNDCSLNEDDFNRKTSIRDSLCISINTASSIQDISRDVIIGRVNTISSILMDLSQLSDDGLGNCTAALLDTIRSFPDISGTKSVAPLCVNALSTVLEQGKKMSVETSKNITATIETLTTGLQTNLAIGEGVVSLNTKNVRIGTIIFDPLDATSTTLSPPQTTAEAFEGSAKSEVALDQLSGSTGLESVGLTVMEYNTNPNGGKSLSKGIGIKLSTFTSTSGSRRRLDSSSPSSDILFTLQNYNRVKYYFNASYNGTIMCDGKSNYNVSIYCPSGKQEVLCPFNELSNGSLGVNITYYCPEEYNKAICQSYSTVDGVYGLYEDSFCTVVKATETNTTCKCSSSSRRRLGDSDSSGALKQYSSSTVIVAEQFKNTAYISTHGPTFTPSTMPTKTPTSEPTATPTEVPTEAPTFKPSEIPTIEPTPSPTSEPTTAKPSVSPTPRPTAAPTTAAPTARPTKDTTISVTFTSNFIIGGFASDSLDSTSEFVLINVTASAMKISKDFVTLSSYSLQSAIAGVYGRRGLGSYQLSVVLLIQVFLEDFPFYSSPIDLYTDLAKSLRASVDTGSFTASLNKMAYVYGSTALLQASCSKIIISDPIIIYPKAIIVPINVGFYAGISIAVLIAAVAASYFTYKWRLRKLKKLLQPSKNPRVTTADISLANVMDDPDNFEYVSGSSKHEMDFIEYHMDDDIDHDFTHGASSEFKELDGSASSGNSVRFKSQIQGMEPTLSAIAARQRRISLFTTRESNPLGRPLYQKKVSMAAAPRGSSTSIELNIKSEAVDSDKNNSGIEQGVMLHEAAFDAHDQLVSGTSRSQSIDGESALFNEVSSIAHTRSSLLSSESAAPKRKVISPGERRVSMGVGLSTLGRAGRPSMGLSSRAQSIELASEANETAILASGTENKLSAPPKRTSHGLSTISPGQRRISMGMGLGNIVSTGTKQNFPVSLPATSGDDVTFDNIYGKEVREEHVSSRPFSNPLANSPSGPTASTERRGGPGKLSASLVGVFEKKEEVSPPSPPEKVRVPLFSTKLISSRKSEILDDTETSVNDEKR